MQDEKVSINQSGDGNMAIAYVENYYEATKDLEEPIKLLYKSSITTKVLIEELLTGVKGDVPKTGDNILPSAIYKISGLYSFTSRFDIEMGFRYVQMKVENQGFTFIADMLASNWVSKSYLNNATRAGKLRCTGWLKVLSIKEDECVSQLLILGDDLYV